MAEGAHGAVGHLHLDFDVLPYLGHVSAGESGDYGGCLLTGGGQVSAQWQLLKQFGADCDEVATVAKGAKLEGRNMSMFLSPKNSK